MDQKQKWEKKILLHFQNKSTEKFESWSLFKVHHFMLEMIHIHK